VRIGAESKSITEKQQLKVEEYSDKESNIPPQVPRAKNRHSEYYTHSGIQNWEGDQFKRIDTRSDYDDEDELREEVCDLPPKIEDIEVEDYEEESDNELPTVVIDSSLDEKEFSQ